MSKNVDSQQASRGVSEWRNRFRWLGEYGMEPVYLAMVGMARCKRHFESLYESLPSNAKVLRADFLEMKRNWVRLVRPEIDQGPAPSRNEVAATVLEALCPKHSLCAYYLKKLRNESRLEPGAARLTKYDYPPILANAEGSPDGSVQFTLTIQNHPFELRAFLDEEGKRFFFQLVIDEHTLIEELTYRILKAFSPSRYMMFLMHLSPEGGHEVDFSYTMSTECRLAEGLLDHLSLQENRDFTGQREFVASDGFLESFRISLAGRLGLELDSVGEIQRVAPPMA